MTTKLILSQKLHFSKTHFSKNSARDRAPPKQSLLTSFIVSIAMNFYTLIAFQ